MKDIQKGVKTNSFHRTLLMEDLPTKSFRQDLPEVFWWILFFWNLHFRIDKVKWELLYKKVLSISWLGSLLTNCSIPCILHQPMQNSVECVVLTCKGVSWKRGVLPDRSSVTLCLEVLVNGVKPMQLPIARLVTLKEEIWCLNTCSSNTTSNNWFYITVRPGQVFKVRALVNFSFK